MSLSMNEKSTLAVEVSHVSNFGVWLLTVTFVHNNIPVNKIDVFMVCIMLFVETFVRCLLLMENL
jgi:hypothetical protein